MIDELHLVNVAQVRKISVALTRTSTSAPGSPLIQWRCDLGYNERFHFEH
jgi:hypothetical protein